MRLLTDLVRGDEAIVDASALPSIAVGSITADSREVTPGTLYVAIRGTKNDGERFIPDAIRAGAAAILCDAASSVDADGAVIVRSRSVRRSLAKLAAAFYARQPVHVVAITGTDGKTSTADFFRQIAHGLGRASASIGTLGARLGNGQTLQAESQTTPGPVALHRLLADLADQSVTHLAMEASSHGLDQYRLDGVRLEAAAFTNLARDHLDYHADEEAYFQAKARLFSELLPPGKTAILNQDDARFAALQKIAHARGLRVVGFGRRGGDWRIRHIEPQPGGQRADIQIYNAMHHLTIPLAGAFQVMNLVAALALIEAVGADLSAALRLVPTLAGVPGRLEHIVTLPSGAAAFIDYAHTPAALANILRTLRPHARGKLHIVFGCGGDRDPGKRGPMGAAAAELADHVIVTDDNPRREDPAAIRRAVLAGCPGAREIGDRRAAIHAALQQLGPGDVLVVAGKGHERTQTIGDTAHPFDDAQVIREEAGI